MARMKKSRTAFAAVDVGASKAACLIVEPAAERAAEPYRIVGAACRPVDRGAGRALSALASAVRAAVAAAEENAGVVVEQAILAAPGRKVRARRMTVEVDLAGRPATREDVDAALAAGLEAAAPEDFAALHALPAAYSIDGDGGWADPLGLSGRLLEIDMLGLSVRESWLAAMETAVEAAHLLVARAVAAPYAAARAVTIADEREVGCLVLDMGAEETGLAAFEGGRAVHVGAAPLGGAHVTRDIVRVLGVDPDAAERLKVLHGSAIADAADADALRARALGGDGTVETDQTALRAVIAPRVGETFERVRAEAASAGVDARLYRHVVLAGGASQLAGAREAAERVFGAPARLAKPLYADGAPAAASGPAFAAVYGLASAAFDDDGPLGADAAAPALGAGASGGWARRLIARF